jgi:hypothetical protein
MFILSSFVIITGYNRPRTYERYCALFYTPMDSLNVLVQITNKTGLQNKPALSSSIPALYDICTSYVLQSYHMNKL